MKNLDLLIKLQDCYITLENNNKVIKDGSDIYFLKKLKDEFEENKIKYKSKEEQLDNIKKEYKEISLKTKRENKNIKEKEYFLYNEAKSDIKIIERLENDIEKSKNAIKDLENLAIELIEKDEKISTEKENLREELKIIKVNFDEYKKNSSKKINEAKIEIDLCEKTIKHIRTIIEKDLLEKFDKIKKSKKIAIVPLEKGICKGCRVRVSSMILDKTKRGEKVVYCDNCGRILYKIEEKKLKKVE
ncbi:zinc ribbon domain-containing protein [Clostridium sp. FAM 1755]|uniref:zinc ribbon domain-containing protein n=1 Tax=Clostridium TaxID=1485 RepID=UPI0006AB8FD7|nr:MULTISPECIES: C4-type zinc ribbon domain-containing protein [Clostridium]EJP6472889.1 DNA-binding protein [Clostridium botulinum]KOR24312.1 DNA-binding protein [Clostridium sp. L74]NFV12752.1 DNA-binding protein [Clostridium sporogenes]